MSDSIIQTLIIVVGVATIAWPLIWILKRTADGDSALSNTKKALEARKLEREYNSNQIEGRK